MKTFLIDDDCISNYLTEQVLVQEGFPRNIRSFLAADEALKVLMQDFPLNVPDVIFLDLNMPIMNGWEFLNAMEPYKDDLLGECRIYILSTSLDVYDKAKSAKYDLVSGFIHKPIYREDVRAILSDIDDNH